MLGVVIQNNYRLCAALQASNQALYMQKIQFPRTLEQDLSSRHYYSRERNGRIIPIGIIKIKEVITINPQDNDTFEFVYVEYSTYETETYSATIPYNDFVAKRILKHLYKFQKHIDCPDKILRFVALWLNNEDLFLEPFLERNCVADTRFKPTLLPCLKITSATVWSLFSENFTSKFRELISSRITYISFFRL